MKEMTQVNNLDKWIDGYRDAWERRDADAVIALFTPDASYRSNILEEPHRGHTGIADYWRDVTATQSDVKVRMGTPFVDGRRVSVEFWTNMKVDGEDVTLPGCLLLAFDENWTCSELREYWQFQPGDISPPPEWGS
jgi:hypothetical protein